MVSIKAYVTVDTTPSAMSKYLSANAVSCVAVILLQSWSPSRRVVYVDYSIVGKKIKRCYQHSVYGWNCCNPWKKTKKISESHKRPRHGHRAMPKGQRVFFFFVTCSLLKRNGRMIAVSSEKMNVGYTPHYVCTQESRREKTTWQHNIP